MSNLRTKVVSELFLVQFVPLDRKIFESQTYSGLQIRSFPLRAVFNTFGAGSFAGILFKFRHAKAKDFFLLTTSVFSASEK